MGQVTEAGWLGISILIYYLRIWENHRYLKDNNDSENIQDKYDAMKEEKRPVEEGSEEKCNVEMKRSIDQMNKNT